MCIRDRQNALKDYPYTNLREDLSILILRAKYELAVYSVEDRRAERSREAVDECYALSLIHILASWSSYLGELVIT